MHSVTRHQRRVTPPGAEGVSEYLGSPPDLSTCTSSSPLLNLPRFCLASSLHRSVYQRRLSHLGPSPVTLPTRPAPPKPCPSDLPTRYLFLLPPPSHPLSTVLQCFSASFWCPRPLLLAPRQQSRSRLCVSWTFHSATANESQEEEEQVDTEEKESTSSIVLYCPSPVLSCAQIGTRSASKEQHSLQRRRSNRKKKKKRVDWTSAQSASHPIALHYRRHPQPDLPLLSLVAACSKPKTQPKFATITSVRQRPATDKDNQSSALFEKKTPPTACPAPSLALSLAAQGTQSVFCSRPLSQPPATSAPSRIATPRLNFFVILEGSCFSRQNQPVCTLLYLYRQLALVSLLSCRCDLFSTSSASFFIPAAKMEQWQVGPVPEYVYSNSTHPPNAMHNNPYQTAEMAGRRNERIEFPYTGQPGMAPHQPQHPAPVQPSMNVPQPQQPPSGPGSQQQTPAPTPQPNRRGNKRPAPGTVPSPATPVAVPAVTPGQPPVPTPPNAQSAAPPAAPAPADDSSVAPSQPPAKKSRTNTPWTPGEELRLKQMRDAGNSWAEIAKTFPTRTEGSVKKHWYKDMHYAEFAEDESQALLNAIKDYENNKWKVIGQKVGKPAKACEQYAKEHFPDLFASTKR